MHNNNVETAVHKLFEQQPKLCKVGPESAIGQVHLLSGILSDTRFSIIRCRK